MRSRRPVLAAAIALASGCGDDLAPLEQEPADRGGAVVVMTYNVQQQGAGARGRTIADHIARRAPDFVALQELSQPDALGSLLPARYALSEAPRAGIAILYDRSRWELVDHGSRQLGFDDDGWGAREVVWGRFLPRNGGEPVHVYSTHWCYPYRSEDDRCDEARQIEYAAATAEYVRSTRGDEPAVLGGDLNIWDHFEQGAPFLTLIDAGLVDVYRILHPEGRGLTRPDPTGGDGGGRIDFVLPTPPRDLIDASIEDEIPIGEGSDHYAVRAALRFGAASTP